jgi:hypothetical protein
MFKKLSEYNNGIIERIDVNHLLPKPEVYDNRMLLLPV